MKPRYFSMSSTFGAVRGFLIFCMAGLIGMFHQQYAIAQDAPSERVAILVVGSDTTRAKVGATNTQADELAYSLVWKHGYFRAQLVQAAWKSDTLFAKFGPAQRYKWDGEPRITLTDSIAYFSVPKCDLSGRLYYEDELRSCLLSISDEAARIGYLSPKVHLDSLITDDDRNDVIAEVSVSLGSLATLSEVAWVGLENTGPEWLEQVAGIREKMPITQLNVQRVVARLSQTRLFESIQEPDIFRSGDNWGISFTVDERPLTFFDLIVGYVPDVSGNATIAGTGSLHVRNAAFDGTDLTLEFDRQSQRVGRLDVGLEQNRILGYPIGVSGQFSLLRQDTLWQNRSTVLGAWWEVYDNVRIYAGVNRDVSTAAASFSNAADLWGTYGQLGFSFGSRDGSLMRSKGASVEILAETGRQIVKPSSGERYNQNRRKLSSRIDYSIPVFMRHGIIPGLSAGALVTRNPQQNDLWRVGGAKTLRGYREDQFYAKSYLWGDLEYRFLLDSQSYLFTFGSAGWLWLPRFEDQVITENRELVRSVGFGLAFQTNLGLLKFTYAKSPEDPFSNAKVHVGISSGF